MSCSVTTSNNVAGMHPQEAHTHTHIHAKKRLEWVKESSFTSEKSCLTMLITRYIRPWLLSICILNKNDDNQFTIIKNTKGKWLLKTFSIKPKQQQQGRCMRVLSWKRDYRHLHHLTNWLEHTSNRPRCKERPGLYVCICVCVCVYV